jgi:hypothetical protein
MNAPAIRLVTDDDMRAITSRDLSPIHRLPHLYIVTDDGEVMRSWGIAHERTVADYARLFPAALVAPKDFGQYADRGELLYNGAEPAAAFANQVKQSR